MILQDFGELCTAQDFSAEAKDSENVLLMAAVDWTSLTNVYWVVQTETIATGDGSDTYAFVLYASQEETLDTIIQIASVTVSGYASYTLATAGNNIVNLNICDQVHQILGTDLSDYPYLGMITTISAGATISINAALSPSPAPSPYNSQVLRSNVGVPS